ncbi:MAG: hypothetical protein WAN50_01720 [Minisyncoccia bacterium]
MRFLSSAIILILALPVAALAQSVASTNPFDISVNPQYPTPNSTATISFTSNSLDLANATVTVTANGTRLYQGAVEPVPITLGRAGSATNISATVVSEGESYTQQITIQPEDVVLVVEPISSAPPLYPGKSLVPLEGSSRIVAMANLETASGKTLDPSTLSYAWTVDDAQIGDSSGIGKDSIIVASPMQYRRRTVSVVVMSTDGALVGSAGLSLIPQQPTVRIYENDSLLGIEYNRALAGSYALPGAEESLYAGTFSFPTATGAPSVRWFLNGAAAQTGDSITLRPTGSGQGAASLSLTASAGTFTTATQALTVMFGQTSRGFNLFGL